MDDQRTVEIMILGSGPAGCSAAVYAARAMRRTVVLEGLQPGGQLTITTDVENYPGIAAAQGPDLMVGMREHAAGTGAEFVQEEAISVDLSVRPFEVRCDGGGTWRAQALILATGATARWLGLESETRFKGHGVSACATCDGFFFRGQEVVVVGGGNTAVEEALFLTHFASRVRLVHRRDSLRAERILQQRLFADPKIEPVWNHVLDEVCGEADPLRVTGARLRHVSTAAVLDIPCSGVFVAIGHEPATSLVAGQLEMDPAGYVIPQPGSARTSVPGVFVAGDVADSVYRQAVTAAGTGCMAALDADRFLSTA